MQAYWTSGEIPDLTDKYAVVTGAGRELGQLIIRRLSEHGANVFAVSRDELSREQFGEHVEPMRMIPTSMASIRRGAERIRDQVSQVDILIHAASISVAPRFRSAEGHGLMLATNYLGFVMLAHELAPAMSKSSSPRVVLAGSDEPITVNLDLDHLDADADMDWDAAYAQSRLAAMMFALELNGRAEILRSSLLSTVAEIRERATVVDARHPIRKRVQGIMSRVNGEPGDAPVLPVLYASTSDRVQGGQYYAAHHRSKTRVEPDPSRIPVTANDRALRHELWQRTEHLLGIQLDVA
jgi:hypothetical protein